MHSQRDQCRVLASQIFTEAFALIDTPDKWCRGGYAAKENDCPIDFESPVACKFCSLGAIYKVLASHRTTAVIGLEKYTFPDEVFQIVKLTLPPSYQRGGLADLNDFGGYEKVVEFFKQAIANAQQLEGSDGNPENCQPATDDGKGANSLPF